MGSVQNPNMRKCLFLSVFTVFSGGRWITGGGVYIYICMYAPYSLGLRIWGLGCLGGFAGLGERLWFRVPGLVRV